jgi:hypothetical protein
MWTKAIAYIFYHLMLWLSRHVSFSDFTKIWNLAYAAHVEEEWTRLKRNSLNIKYMQDGLEVAPEALQRGLPSKLTLLKPVSSDGQEEKPLMPQSSKQPQPYRPLTRRWE